MIVSNCHILSLNFSDPCHGHCIRITVTPDIFSFLVGIKTADDQSEGVLLHVAGMASGISISKLDDSDISEVNHVLIYLLPFYFRQFSFALVCILGIFFDKSAVIFLLGD